MSPQADAVVCPGCGHANDEAALFCAGCGAALAQSRAADALLGRQILGAYEIEQLLGKGGMSVVYLARHVLTDQVVAVKILPPELAGQREIKARFIEEARALALLEHPNIVILHNLAEEDGHLYLVMQYAEGQPLDERIGHEGRMPIPEAVAVAVEVLRALEYAHERGVVHRDIKPSNVILRDDGAVKVMDFGLAKFVGSTKLTQTGLTMGTVRYMSPEQVRGKQVDHRSDLYSLGVTLYEAICGHTPFEGETHFDIMHQHLKTPPPPLGQVVSVPDELQAVMDRALAKSAEERFQTARELRRALQQLPLPRAQLGAASSSTVVPLAAADDPADASPPVAGRRRMVVGVGVAAAVLVVGGAVALWAMGRGDDGEERPASPPRGADGRSPRGPTARPWPQPHPLVSELSWRVDRTFGAPDRLRVLARQSLDPTRIRAIYRRAREAYEAYLRQEGLDVDVKVGPLNLAIVSQKVLNSPEHWPGVKAHTDYPTRYQAPSATLFVRDGRGFSRTDLPYGLALHFCARIARLSNQRCLDLAEGFERYFRGAAP